MHIESYLCSFTLYYISGSILSLSLSHMLCPARKTSQEQKEKQVLEQLNHVEVATRSCGFMAKKTLVGTNTAVVSAD